MENANAFAGRDICRYQHRAMATLYEIMVAGESPEFAEQAAYAAFHEIDRIELELSRYLPNSDISRINNLEPGGSVRVGLDAFQCLQIGVTCWKETGGAFDATVGALMDCWIGKERTLLHPSSDSIERARIRTGMELIRLNEPSCEVGVSDHVPQIDLGAVGKGYAVDRAGELLQEWGIASALVHAGMSSVLAWGDAPECVGWPVTLSAPGDSAKLLQKVFLKDRSLSGSGIRRGLHIMNPRTARPVQSRRAAWVCESSAARSDAISTACMIMTHEEIARYCTAHKQLWVMIIDEGAEGRPEDIVTFGLLNAV